jgi:hypothetical protein
MNELVEKGKKPENCNPCYVTCPKCGVTADYWQSGSNTFYNERSVFNCLACHTSFDVIGLGDGIVRLATEYDK